MGKISNNFLRYMDLIGILRLIRYCSANIPQIVMYHGVINDKCLLKCWWQIKESDFKKQIQYIHNNFRVISMDDIYKSIISNEVFPRNACVLTFDDGYRSYLTKVLPILETKKMPSTVYISSEISAKKGIIWTDRVFNSLDKVKQDTLDLNPFELGIWKMDNDTDRIESIHGLINRLKMITPFRRKMVIDYIERFSEAEKTQQLTNPFRLLSVDEIKELSRSPLVTIGSHSMSHEILTHLDKGQAEHEIIGSKKLIESWINQPVNHFAYPDGKLSSFLEDIVQKAGYQTACRIGLGQCKRTELFRMNRQAVGAWDNISYFKAMMNGAVTLKIELRERINHLFVKQVPA